MNRKQFGSRAALVLILATLSTGCSLRTIAVNRFGDAIAGGGSTFAADDDPDLVGGALPFSLKPLQQTDQ